MRSSLVLERFQSTQLDDRYLGSVLLERRSLFVMTDDMYTHYLHGIKERKSDVIDHCILNADRCATGVVGCDLERGTRVSLTIRHVPKVLKTKLFLGGKRF